MLSFIKLLRVIIYNLDFFFFIRTKINLRGRCNSTWCGRCRWRIERSRHSMLYRGPAGSFRPNPSKRLLSQGTTLYSTSPLPSISNTRSVNLHWYWPGKSQRNLKNRKPMRLQDCIRSLSLYLSVNSSTECLWRNCPCSVFCADERE